MADTITKDKVVLIHYTLTNDRGEELDSSRGDEPLPYLHGHGNIVPGLEKALDGKEIGFKGVIDVSPAEGYGEHDGSAPQVVPISAFPDDYELEEGMPIIVENEEGDHFPVWIAGKQNETVLLDSNHPLAGEALHFDVEVVRMRDAIADELMHGHPHGPDGDAGHHHGH